MYCALSVYNSFKHFLYLSLASYIIVSMTNKKSEALKSEDAAKLKIGFDDQSPIEVDKLLIADLRAAVLNAFEEIGVRFIEGSFPSPASYRELADKLGMDWRPLKNFLEKPNDIPHIRTIRNLSEMLKGVIITKVNSYVELSDYILSQKCQRLIFDHVEKPNDPIAPYEEGILEALADIKLLHKLARDNDIGEDAEARIKRKSKHQAAAQTALGKIEKRGNFLMAAPIPLYNQPPQEFEPEGIIIRATTIILISGLNPNDFSTGKYMVDWNKIVL